MEDFYVLFCERTSLGRMTPTKWAGEMLSGFQGREPNAKFPVPQIAEYQTQGTPQKPSSPTTLETWHATTVPLAGWLLAWAMVLPSGAYHRYDARSENYHHQS